MNIERKKVLEMLAGGKITAEDAEKLLDALDAAAPGGSGSSESGVSGSPAKKHRYLRIVVDKPGEAPKNVRIALPFAGSKLLHVLPPNIVDRLNEFGFDVKNLNSTAAEDILNLEQLNIDVEKENGKRVRIFCE
jgi:hypothetical protein